MRCSRCQKELEEREVLKKGELILCEDCYMKEEEQKDRCCCNPFALRSSRIFQRIQAQRTEERQKGGVSGPCCGS